MAKILGAALLFAQLSFQQDPVTNFCRRFGHQTCQIDRKLFLDGGMIDWNPLSSNHQNFTNIYGSYHDLNTSPSGIDAPQLYTNLSKNATIPYVSGGVLWPDDVNKRFFLYGGETASPANTPTLFSYDSVAWGAGVGVSSIGQGFMLGGWLSNSTMGGWNGEPFATSSLLVYDMQALTWTNNTGPDSSSRAEGVMVYVPASDIGMLIHFGGVTVDVNGTQEPAPMDSIHVYDIKSGLWYTQTASGSIPPARRRFCAGVGTAPDSSSYNIYLYGGAGFGVNGTGFDDVWILSLPSFTWIPYYKGTPGRPHNELTCDVVGGQMLVIGGSFPNVTDDQCDSANTWGVHILDMGYVSGSQWNPIGYQVNNLTSYVVPPQIYSVVGGSAQGGATEVKPSSGYGNSDLGVLFGKKAAVVSRTPTRAITSATSSSSATSSAKSTAIKLSGPAIAGVAVGAAIFVSSLVIGGCFLIRQKRARHAQVLTPAPLVIQRSAPDFSQTPFSPQSQYSHAGTFHQRQMSQKFYQLPAEPEPVELYASHKRMTKETYTKAPRAGSPTSTYSESGFSRSNTLYGTSPPSLPQYKMSRSPSDPPPPMPPPPPNHF